MEESAGSRDLTELAEVLQLARSFVRMLSICLNDFTTGHPLEKTVNSLFESVSIRVIRGSIFWLCRRPRRVSVVRNPGLSVSQVPATVPLGSGETSALA